MQKRFLFLFILALFLCPVANAQQEMQQLQVPSIAPDFKALNKAIADLQRATGNALTVNSIVVRVR